MLPLKAQPEWAKLMIGEMAISLFEGPYGRLVQITDRREEKSSRSGVQYRVHPVLQGCKADDWFDAEWFKVATEQEILKRTVKAQKKGARRNGR